MSNLVSTTGAVKRMGAFTVATLRSWRLRGIGPPYIQPSGPRGKVLYDIAALDAWMQQSRKD